MRGVYTALPAAALPGVPSGWNVNWPFPGVLPPGYEMDLSLSLSVPAQTYPGQTVSSISLGLFDQITYPTTEPTSGITWSAKFVDNGDTVRISDGGGYADSIDQDYSEIDPQWGAEPEIEFDISGMDIGRSIIFASISDPFGDGELDASGILEIIGEPDPIIRIEMSGTVTGEITNGGEPDYWYFSGNVFLYRGGVNKAWVNNFFSAGTGGEGIGWDSSVIQELSGDESSSSADGPAWTIDVAAASQTFYAIKYKMSSGASNPGNDPPVGGDAITFTLEGTVKTYVNGELYDTETFEVVDIDLGIGTILSLGTINGTTGRITIY